MNFDDDAEFRTCDERRADRKIAGSWPSCVGLTSSWTTSSGRLNAWPTPMLLAWFGSGTGVTGSISVSGATPHAARFSDTHQAFPPGLGGCSLAVHRNPDHNSPELVGAPLHPPPRSHVFWRGDLVPNPNRSTHHGWGGG
jgi:hypothetical protein